MLIGTRAVRSQVLLVCLFLALAWAPFGVFLHNFLDFPTTVDPAQPNSDMVVESSHFLLKALEGYIEPSNASNLLDRAELDLASLQNCFNTPPLNGRITLQLMTGWGQSQVGGGRLILWYLAREGHIPLAHDLTHVLMGSAPSRVLTEGLAVFDQDRLGDFDFPDFYSTPDLGAVGVLRRGSFLSLERLGEGYDFVGPNRRTAYLEGGSFVGYLISQFGLPAFEEVYRSGDYQQAYGTSVSELEAAWLSHLWFYSLFLTGVYLLIGLVCLAALSISLSKGSPWWLLIAVLAPQAFSVLDWLILLSLPFSTRTCFLNTRCPGCDSQPADPSEMDQVAHLAHRLGRVDLPSRRRPVECIPRSGSNVILSDFASSAH